MATVDPRRAKFFELLAAGYGQKAAAREVGVSPNTGKSWARRAKAPAAAEYEPPKPGGSGVPAATPSLLARPPSPTPSSDATEDLSPVEFWRGRVRDLVADLAGARDLGHSGALAALSHQLAGARKSLDEAIAAEKRSQPTEHLDAGARLQRLGTMAYDWPIVALSVVARVYLERTGLQLYDPRDGGQVLLVDGVARPDAPALVDDEDDEDPLANFRATPA